MTEFIYDINKIYVNPDDIFVLKHCDEFTYYNVSLFCDEKNNVIMIHSHILPQEIRDYDFFAPGFPLYLLLKGDSQAFPFKYLRTSKGINLYKLNTLANIEMNVSNVKGSPFTSEQNKISTSLRIDDVKLI